MRRGDAVAEQTAQNEGRVVVYGVPLTADRPLDLPELVQAAVFEPVTFQVAQGALERFGFQSRPVRSAHADDMMIQTDGEFDANRPGQRWSLHIGQEISFHWKHGQRVIHYDVHDDAALDDFAYWAVHLVLPMFLALEGVAHIIHGGCVTHGEEAVLFLAPSHGGKSTLVNAFLDQGHRLVSDDKLPLLQRGSRWVAVPSHPMHRPWRGRRDMGQAAGDVADSPRPLSAIYVLDIAEDADATSITNLSGQAAVTWLLKSHLFQLRFLRAQGLEFIGALARSVPMYRVRTPRDLDLLPLMREEILNHLATLEDARDVDS